MPKTAASTLGSSRATKINGALLCRGALLFLHHAEALSMNQGGITNKRSGEAFLSSSLEVDGDSDAARMTGAGDHVVGSSSGAPASSSFTIAEGRKRDPAGAASSRNGAAGEMTIMGNYMHSALEATEATGGAPAPASFTEKRPGYKGAPLQYHTISQETGTKIGFEGGETPRCLNGDPAGYFTEVVEDEKELANKLANGLLIELEGGGWCGDSGGDVLTDCAERARKTWKTGETGYGSAVPATWEHFDRKTKTMETVERKDHTRYAFKDSWADPFFYVYVPYCDGTVFTGDLKEPVTAADGTTMHFHGKRILDSVLAELADRFFAPPIVRIGETEPPQDLSVPNKYYLGAESGNAARVILYGHSAGGLATFYAVDRANAMLQKMWTAAHQNPEVSVEHKKLVVRGASQSGFFVQTPATFGDGNNENAFGRGMERLMDAVNGYPALNEKCLEKFADDKKKCLHLQYFGDLLESPMFVMQSKYDQSEIDYFLAARCPFWTNKICRNSRVPNFIEEHTLFSPSAGGYKVNWVETSRFPGTQSTNAADQTWKDAAHPRLNAGWNDDCCFVHELAEIKNLFQLHMRQSQLMMQHPKHSHFYLDCIAHTVLGMDPNHPSSRVKYTLATLLEERFVGTHSDGNFPSSWKFSMTMDEAFVSWGKDETKVVQVIDGRSWKFTDADKTCHRAP
ncbi:unnamed protein product [Amoebophrya sp. A120]|nr:unnamed protein product [Amoebophrya sp. A120]|eukprot:GSA120T00010927001.1